MKTNLAVTPLPSTVLNQRIDLVLLFSATFSNPQGDPDADNSPRIDDQGYGFVTPQGITRKIRDLRILRGEPIFISRKAVLATQVKAAIDAEGLGGAMAEAEEATDEEDEEAVEDAPEEAAAPKAKAKKAKKAKAKSGDDKKTLSSEQKEAVIRHLTHKYSDVRLFGDVVMFGKKVGSEPIQGPIQIGYSTSVDPVYVQEMALTRVAVTTEEESEKQGGQNRTMGRSFVIPFALYRCHISINPFNARRTGMTWADYDQFIEDLQAMFELSKSRGRSGMAVERIVEFRHNSELGSMPSHKLQRRVTVTRLNPKGLSHKELGSPRSMGDYDITVNEDDLPESIQVRTFG